MRAFARKYGLLLYWLLFGVFAFHQSQYPGLMLNPEEWRYPWSAALIVWIFVGVLIVILNLILRPKTYYFSWGRLIIALAYSALLVTVGLAFVATDLPGYYYVPAQFALINMACMLLFAALQCGIAIWQRLKQQPNKALKADATKRRGLA